MRYVPEFLESMLLPMLVSLVFIVIFRVLSYTYMKKRNIKTTVTHEIGMVVFCLSTVGLASQAIFPQAPLVFPFQGGYNFIPFRVIYDSIEKGILYSDWDFLFVNIIGNIAVFMPMGFFVPLLFRNITLKKTLLIGFLGSLCIEICQIPQKRVTDIDDLWLNTLGAFAGYLVYILFRKIFNEKQFKVLR